MAERYELHEWQWQRIRDLFPPPKATGRKRRDPRQMLDAIFWILCGGAPWRDLPERYGPYRLGLGCFLPRLLEQGLGRSKLGRRLFTSGRLRKWRYHGFGVAPDRTCGGSPEPIKDLR
jgi:hypothetical protein